MGADGRLISTRLTSSDWPADLADILNETSSGLGERPIVKIGALKKTKRTDSPRINRSGRFLIERSSRVNKSLALAVFDQQQEKKNIVLKTTDSCQRY